MLIVDWWVTDDVGLFRRDSTVLAEEDKLSVHSTTSLRSWRRRTPPIKSGLAARREPFDREFLPCCAKNDRVRVGSSLVVLTLYFLYNGLIQH